MVVGLAVALVEQMADLKVDKLAGVKADHLVDPTAGLLDLL